MLRTQFEIMRDRHNLKWNLEWVSKSNGESSLKGRQTDNFEKFSVHSKMSELVPKENSIRVISPIIIEELKDMNSEYSKQPIGNQDGKKGDSSSFLEDS